MNRRPVARIALIAILKLGLLTTGGAETKELKGNAQFGYASILLDKGGSFYGEQGSVTSDLNADLWQTGLGVGVHHRSATGDGYVEKQRFDYKLSYSNQIFDDEPYQTNYALAYVYHDFYKAEGANGHEFVLGLSWNHLKMAGIKYSYDLVYETGEHSSAEAGFYHQFGVSYAYESVIVASLLCPGAPQAEEPINLGAEIAYRDGLGGSAVDRGFSHAVFSISTNLRLSDAFIVMPTLQHQISMEDTVNEENETAFSIAAQFSF